MRESLLAIPGVIFLLLGALVFFISSEIKVFIGVSPFSIMLIVLFVAGLILLGVGLANFIGDRLE